MARIKHIHKIRTSKFAALDDAARCVGETNDCAVKAIAAATDTPYLIVHKMLASKGRKHGGSTWGPWMREVLKELGFEIRVWQYDWRNPKDTNVATRNLYAIIRNYPGNHGRVLKSITTHHPVRFAKQWQFARGRSFIAHTSGGGHVAAIVDGDVHDWTKGRAARICEMWEIVKR